MASVKLEEVIEKHQARVPKNKHSIMSKVYMEAQPGNCQSTKGSGVVLAVLTADPVLPDIRSGCLQLSCEAVPT